MRVILADTISSTIERLCIEANRNLPKDVRDAIVRFRTKERWPAAQAALDDIIVNFALAERKEVAICQDAGIACVFIEIGQDVHVDGNMKEAVNEGVRRGYTKGYLRSSMVKDPLLNRVNTGDNTPALIHYEIVPGDRLKITVAPKGAGSENMSRTAMLIPTDGVDGLRRFVLETIELAGAVPCPPVIIGVGIGGSFDRAALLAKKALLRPLDAVNEDPRYAEIESLLLNEVNALGIGPQGFGGYTTAIGLNIEVYPCHIGQLPCAVNLGCHVTRRQTVVL